MNGIEITLRVRHDGERDLVDELTAVAPRHRTEHEVHHVATDLATWSDEHGQRLSDVAADYGLQLADAPGTPSDGTLATLRKKASETAGHRPEPGLLLPRDLRRLHLAAAENSLHWEILVQTAQAAKDAKLLSLSFACHPRTLRQLR